MSDPDPLQELYSRIPHTECRAGCFKCCINSIQMSDSEREAIGGYEWKGKCPKLDDQGRCAVYDKRPLVCRLYGASELLVCDGCVCGEPLSEKETESILKDYRKISGELK